MMSAPAPRSFYDLLGVRPEASAQAVRDAWRAQVMQLHPDRVIGSRPHAEARLREINRAYTILKDPRTRAAYDAFLSRRTPPCSAPGLSLAARAPSSRWHKALDLAREILWPLAPAEARHGR